MIARQWRGRLRHRGPQAGPPHPVTTDQPADLLIGHGRVGDDGQKVIQQRLPVLPRSASASRVLRSALLSRAEMAWSKSCTTSSSTSVADCASTVSRMG